MASPELSRLRKILDDARDAAKRVGGEPQAELEGVGYFADAPTSGIISAVDEIAAWDGKITLFIGAGVSMESELPSWNELVRRLLVGADDSGDGSETVDAWVATVLEEGPLAAAAVAEALYPDEGAFRRALREALYPQRERSAYAPGALAGQIAWLKQLAREAVGDPDRQL